MLPILPWPKTLLIVWASRWRAPSCTTKFRNRAVDEKQYREIYLPAVAGDEAALNQLLEWASLLSAGWESRSEAYRLVKDLRTDHETGNVDAVLDGQIDDFIEAYLHWRRATG